MEPDTAIAHRTRSACAHDGTTVRRGCLLGLGLSCFRTTSQQKEDTLEKSSAGKGEDGGGTETAQQILNNTGTNTGATDEELTKKKTPKKKTKSTSQRQKSDGTTKDGRAGTPTNDKTGGKPGRKKGKAKKTTQAEMDEMDTVVIIDDSDNDFDFKNKGKKRKTPAKKRGNGDSSKKTKTGAEKGRKGAATNGGKAAPKGKRKPSSTASSTIVSDNLQAVTSASDSTASTVITVTAAFPMAGFSAEQGTHATYSKKTPTAKRKWIEPNPGIDSTPAESKQKKRVYKKKRPAASATSTTSARDAIDEDGDSGGTKAPLHDQRDYLNELKHLLQDFSDVLKDIKEKTSCGAHINDVKNVLDSVCDGNHDVIASGSKGGGKNVEVTANETVYYDAEEAGSLLACEGCDIPRILGDLAQCPDGHVVCKTCLGRAATAVLASQNEEDLACPLRDCKRPVPLPEIERVLHPVVVDILKERRERSVRSQIASMDGMVQCPKCSFPVEMATDEKMFQCLNLGCFTACCRYCKKDWRDYDHSACSTVATDTGKTTRGDGKASFSAPHNWVPFPDNHDEDYYIAELDLAADECKTVLDYFNRTVGPDSGQIQAIFRIQNVRLMQKFQLLRQHMVEDLREEKVNEVLLFHGTDADNVHAICTEGFDWRLCGKNGVSYGKGSYFSSSAAYSLKYCIPCDPIIGTEIFPYKDKPPNVTYQPDRQTSLMFVARVLCGRSVVGNPKMRRPPPDPLDPKGRLFNSTCDRQDNPSIFVVYDVAQAYPEYVLAIK